MISDLKPYARYKASGLPWVGEVPAHWTFLPNRALIRKRKVLVGQRHGEYQLLSLTKQGVIFRDTSTGKGKFSSDMGTSQEVRPGDLVFCLFDVPETPRTVGLSRHAGMITGAYTVFETLGRGDADYFELFYRAMDEGKLLSPLYSGLRNTIPAARFLGTKTPQPPEDEQVAIIRFLTRASGRLERAIRAKRKVIALLNEQKQAVIHRAVTHGLDDSVRLSSSEELFERARPIHWPVFRAKWLLRQVVPDILEGAEIVTCFRDGQVTLRSNRRTTGFMNAIWELGYQGIRPGQLVLHSMDAFAGAIGVSDSSGKCSPEYVICEAGMPEISLEYYAYLLRSLALRGLFVALCPSVRERAPRVRFSDFARFSLPKPPYSEQVEIVEHIHKSCAAIDAALSKLRAEVNLLNELKARLIADVVTGQLDVREAAARLPNEASEEDNELIDEPDTEEEAPA